MCYRRINQNELYHYGILGMRWGHRKEYESKGQRKKRLTKENNEEYNEKKSKKPLLSDKQKKYLKIGASVALTALVSYGSYKLYKSGKLDKYIDKGKAKINKFLGSKKGKSKLLAGDLGDLGKAKVESILGNTEKAVGGGFKKLAKPESISEAIMHANPNRKNTKYKNNCTRCSLATFLRTQGYDIIAKDSNGKGDDLIGVVQNAFKGARTIEGKASTFGKSKKDASEFLVKKFGENASGVCAVQLKTMGGQGHAFNWSIKDGTVTFFDGQPNKEIGKNVDFYFNNIVTEGYLHLARLDNAIMNLDGIKMYVE